MAQTASHANAFGGRRMCWFGVKLEKNKHPQSRIVVVMLILMIELATVALCMHLVPEPAAQFDDHDDHHHHHHQIQPNGSLRNSNFNNRSQQHHYRHYHHRRPNHNEPKSKTSEPAQALGTSAPNRLSESLIMMSDDKEPENESSSSASSSSSSSSSKVPKLNNMRRLLVRQLTNLIMNHEPESIAEYMEGTKISGQMVSESALEESEAARLSSDDSMRRFIDPVDGETNNMMAASSSSSSSSDGASQLNADKELDGSGNQVFEATDQSNQRQESDSGSGSTNGGGSTLEQAELITCSPDYDDQAPFEATGNLTAEQQQQLFADSSGLLATQTSVVNEANGIKQITPTTTTALIGRSNVNGSSQCVHPGNRMIEFITKVLTPILFGIIIVVGLLGNIIVMLVILEDRKTERELTPANLLILDLSLADLSFIIFCIPFTGWDYAVGHWVFGQLWCKCNQYLIVVCALSSIYTLVLMSVDRFMAIVYPIECISYRTSKNTLYAIYIKWIIILFIASPTISMHGLVELALGEPDQYNCRFLIDQYNPLHFQIAFFITSYLFPLILIFCLYLRLLNKLWFGTKPHGHKESHKMLESKKKVTWLVAGIVIVFALCWCPIQIMLILMRLKSHRITATYVAIQVFSHILGYMNSCVNPIVYAFASETFHNSFKRSSFGRFLCGLCCCIKSHPERDRSHSNANRPGTTTQNNNATVTISLNHNKILTNQQHHQQQQQQQQQPTDQVQINKGSLGNDNKLNSTTLLIAAYESNNNSENSNRIVTLPLEPRDRGSPIVGNTNKSQDAKTQVREAVGPVAGSTSQQVALNNESSCIDGSTQSITPAKQHLVAHVVQSGNQVSHKCAPCYFQE